MKKRFIAGAVCPKCQTLDRIIMLTDANGHEHIECIECDYTDIRPDKDQITQQHNQATADDIGVIQFRPRS